jgi:ketosteroid isomerase-like protein
MVEGPVQAENVALARRSFELFSEGGVEAARPSWAEDCIWHDPPDFPDADSYFGPDAVAERLEEIWDILPLDGLGIEETIALGKANVLLILGFKDPSAGARVAADQSIGCIVTVKDGKVREWRPYLKHETARRAAGL